LRVAVLTAKAAAQLDLAMGTVDVHRERAVARAVMYTEHGELAYRQARFYRRTDTGWICTEPDATLWGPTRLLETTFFVYIERVL
jgi:hypothetical protein